MLKILNGEIKSDKNYKIEQKFLFLNVQFCFTIFIIVKQQEQSNADALRQFYTENVGIKR